MHNPQMAKVEIYTWQTCPFCIRAKSLLKKKGINYEEHPIDGDQIARAAMIKKSMGRTSVPQIFIDDKGIGGCDDLYALDKNNELNLLLGLTD